MIDLYKYKYNWIDELQATEDSVKIEIKGGMHQKHNHRYGSYASPYFVKKNTSAQHRLSITYSPNYLYPIDSANLSQLEINGNLTLRDNEQNVVGNLGGLTQANLPRIWPSFGYLGGAREVFMEFGRNAKVKLQKPHKFSIPGKLDFYRQDDDEMLNLPFVENLLQSSMSLFLANEISSESGSLYIIVSTLRNSSWEDRVLPTSSDAVLIFETSSTISLLVSSDGRAKGNSSIVLLFIAR